MEQYVNNAVFTETAQNISEYINDLPLSADYKKALTSFIIEQTKETVKQAVKLMSREITALIKNTLENREAQ